MVRNKMPRLVARAQKIFGLKLIFITDFRAAFESPLLLDLYVLVISAVQCMFSSSSYSPWNSFWVFINFYVCQINISLVSSSSPFLQSHLHLWLQIKLVLSENKIHYVVPRLYGLSYGNEKNNFLWQFVGCFFLLRGRIENYKNETFGLTIRLLSCHESMYV